MAKNYGQVEGPNGEAINPLLDNPKLQIDPNDLQKINVGANQIAYGGKVFQTGFLDGTSHKNSIIGMAKKNVFEFPVFVSDTVPLEYATAVNSLLEQVYASYLQMALSTDPVISSESLKKKGGQFSKFKSNTAKYLECVDLSYQKDSCHAEYHNEDGSYVEFNLMSITDHEAEVINEYMDGGSLSEFDHYFQEETTTTTQADYDGSHKRIASRHTKTTTTLDPDEKELERRRIEAQEKSANAAAEREQREGKIRSNASAASQDVLKAVAYWRMTPEDRRTHGEPGLLARFGTGQFTPEDIDVLSKAMSIYRQDLQNDETIAHTKNIKASTEKIDREFDKLDEEIDALERANRVARKYKSERGEDYEYERMMLDIQQKAETLAHDLERHPIEIDKLRAEREIAVADVKRKAEEHKIRKERHAYDTKIKSAEFIDENKINKMNTMKPLMMVVNMSYMDKAGGISRPIEYIVGVKTHCRVIDSSMLPEVVQYPMKEMDKLTREVKWRAGELKFFKDIVFRIKEKKQTAIDSKDPRRKWFRRLYELAHMKGDGNVSKKIGGSGASHGLIPDVTMVISKADVDNIESVTGIDMLKGSNAKRLCEELFLMNFVVIDQDTQSIKILTPDLHNDFEVQSIGAVERQIAQLSTAGAKTMDIFKNLK